jgi:hypothetical protein
LAASTATNLGFMQVSFLTDSSQLYHFLLGSDQTHPPDWRMKTYTDQFHCSAAQMQASLLNISRNDNCTADSLAKDAYRQATYVHQPCSLSCSFGAHHSKCQLFRALLHVHNPCTLILSALCCWNEMRCLLSKKLMGHVSVPCPDH